MKFQYHIWGELNVQSRQGQYVVYKMADDLRVERFPKVFPYADIEKAEAYRNELEEQNA